MKDLIISIFGTYEPVTYTQIIGEEELVYIPDGFAGVDMPYVLGVLGFFLVLYCFLRLIGGVFSRNR